MKLISGGLLINHKYMQEITPLCPRHAKSLSSWLEILLHETTYLKKRTFLQLTNASVSNNIDISISFPQNMWKYQTSVVHFPVRLKFGNGTCCPLV